MDEYKELYMELERENHIDALNERFYLFSQAFDDFREAIAEAECLLVAGQKSDGSIDIGKAKALHDLGELMDRKMSPLLEDVMKIRL